jgi:hypothetical protein
MSTFDRFESVEQNNPIAWAELAGVSVDPSRPVVLFSKVSVAVLMIFAVLVTVISVPDYLVSNPENHSPEIKALMQRVSSRPVSFMDLAALFWGSLYFCATTLATVGFGDVAPGINFWGRLASLLMQLFDILFIPVILQYILSNHKLAGALRG